MSAPSPDNSDFEFLEEKPVPGLTRRLLTTQRHMVGLCLGAVIRVVRKQKQLEEPDIPGLFLLRIIAFLTRPFVHKELRDLPFPVQLRRRLEILGPTYIKLGQVLSLREDLLPSSITDELKNLLNRLPIVPFERYLELVAQGLNRSVTDMFLWVDPNPVGSASIAQTHIAITVDGYKVVLKLVKPGIKQTLQRDSRLLSWLGVFLQWVIPQYQPKKVLSEFTEYTLREVDLRLEANNAESFAANFKDLDYISFPKIYRKYSSETVLCMEFFDGMRPDDPRALALPEHERAQLLEHGAEAIIRMLYQDGFFHADLHPGNLLILEENRCGFIDLGMVGRFDDQLRRNMLYYYYCLVMGDAENAARYLSSVAQPSSKGNPEAFRRAVEDISRRWYRTANFEEFSLGQLILESVSMGGRYHMYFPMDLVLMVKALVTFEGVGQFLQPNFDVAALSKKHISRIFMGQFNPINLIRESLRGGPEIVDALVKAPLLITQGVRLLERNANRKPDNPFSGLRGTLFAGFSMLSGTVMLAFKEEHWYLALPFFILSLTLVLRRQ